MSDRVNEYGQKIRSCDVDCTNAFMVKGAEFKGYWGMPYIPSVFDEIPNEIVQYTERNSYKGDKSKAALAFFVDDMKFDQRGGIWNTATEDDSNKRGFNFNEIKDYGFIITPDFSVFENFPPGTVMDQVRRSRYFGYWMYKKGMKVIINFRYLDGHFDEYVYDGIPDRATICISTYGMVKKKENKEIILKSFEKIRLLNPKLLIIYGPLTKDMLNCLKDDIPIRHFPAKFRGGMNG